MTEVEFKNIESLYQVSLELASSGEDYWEQSVVDVAKQVIPLVARIRQLDAQMEWCKHSRTESNRVHFKNEELKGQIKQLGAVIEDKDGTIKYLAERLEVNSKDTYDLFEENEKLKGSIKELKKPNLESQVSLLQRLRATEVLLDEARQERDAEPLRQERDSLFEEVQTLKVQINEYLEDIAKLENIQEPIAKSERDACRICNDRWPVLNGRGICKACWESGAPEKLENPAEQPSLMHNALQRISDLEQSRKFICGWITDLEKAGRVEFDKLKDSICNLENAESARAQQIVEDNMKNAFAGFVVENQTDYEQRRAEGEKIILEAIEENRKTFVATIKPLILCPCGRLAPPPGAENCICGHKPEGGAESMPV